MSLQTVVAGTDSAYSLSENDLLVGEQPDQYILKVKDLPNDQKPREKMERLGPKSLSLAELIAVLLGVGTKKEEVLSMSQRIIKEYGEKAIANETNPTKMAEALNIPVSKACQIISGFEFGRRFFAKEAGKPAHIRNSQQAYEYLKDMGSSKKEQLRGLYLNSRYQVIHDEVISIGTVTANLIHPREVFQPAIEHGAVAVIIAHNHPSGNPEPTDADIEVTGQLSAAGKLLGLDLLDHLVIASNEFISVKDQLKNE